MHQCILVLDYGSQVTQLIARRIRDAGVYCEIHPGDDARVLASRENLKGIILSGSHASAGAHEAPRVPSAVFEAGVPVLGICYGMQAMALQLGGEVAFSDHREFGPADLVAEPGSRLLSDLPGAQAGPDGRAALPVWMSHGDQVKTLPPGFSAAGATATCSMAAMEDKTRGFYGVQFHPEVTHTRQGAAILERFVLTICGCTQDWRMPDYVTEAVDRIRAQVGQDEVILGLSGGVDSSVAAALIHRAIGDQLTCVFVDHGLLRMNEGRQVMDTMAAHMGIRVLHVDASAQFMQRLAGVSDPEAKRKAIGHEFVQVFQAQAARLKSARWLAQGTIYPDVIESAAARNGKAVAIKSHHNVGGLPETLDLQLLEPLRDLFKDEVRKLGLALGLPPAMVYRHPFPGPGLGVRVLGEVKPEYVRLLRQADDIFIQELRHTLDPDSGKSWYDLTSQAFTVFLPVRSVGVMGDSRTYEYVVALRAVQTTDFMTAEWAELPYALLKKVSTRIINEVRGINRVTYDVSSKPPATIEWE